MAEARTVRRLPVWAYLVLVVSYLVVIQTLPNLTRPEGADYGKFDTTESITRGLWVTVGLGSAIVLVALGVLRWWRPAFVEPVSLRLPRWVWVFPAVLLLAVVAGAAYSRLADQGLWFTLALLVGALLVGVSEEGMFRGIGVVTFREAGCSEGMVALWTSVVFGLAHATNLFSEGLGALPQVLVTAAAGYFFYVARRVSGGLLVPILVHGLWDFGAVSGRIGDTTYLGTFTFLLADVALVVVALVTIRKVFPRHLPGPDVSPRS
ncbi:CPBP family intramembrane glutamic endopeptidase [Nocardioides bruguierae]|uniref:CPBP family intramembrane glutamic endopeptidase n=1 Tax=Nocardioides bruguierae TaxID=2945102 RepID=UPI002021FC87|nr:CPBP family intramembrane glutamic endopeptidase [Nocardioides bruguierae]MCL8024863.1 CPBP family intramembrane metalloprotease [Nocardioides bruguierae]